VRFIPTCVGKIPSIFGTRQNEQVHPHVCGENDEPLYL